ncbi:MAG TPA: hypothetical protein VM120_22505 [Bryobacteraceae bacterium]|nr:hypothetical protein [Bryobacteraceae bacterium]
MRLSCRQYWALITTLTVFGYTMQPAPARAAESHVVPLEELQKELLSAAGKRTQDLADLARVLSLPAAQEALAKANLNTALVKTAVASLSDQELSRLARQARAAEQDVEGGIIVGILALIGLIVVIIIVLAIVRS